MRLVLKYLNSPEIWGKLSFRFRNQNCHVFFPCWWILDDFQREPQPPEAKPGQGIEFSNIPEKCLLDAVDGAKKSGKAVKRLINSWIPTPLAWQVLHPSPSRQEWYRQYLVHDEYQGWLVHSPPNRPTHTPCQLGSWLVGLVLVDR